MLGKISFIESANSSPFTRLHDFHFRNQVRNWKIFGLLVFSLLDERCEGLRSSLSLPVDRLCFQLAQGNHMVDQSHLQCFLGRVKFGQKPYFSRLFLTCISHICPALYIPNSGANFVTQVRRQQLLCKPSSSVIFQELRDGAFSA